MDLLFQRNGAITVKKERSSKKNVKYTRAIVTKGTIQVLRSTKIINIVTLLLTVIRIALKTKACKTCSQSSLRGRDRMTMPSKSILKSEGNKTLPWIQVDMGQI